MQVMKAAFAIDSGRCVQADASMNSAAQSLEQQAWAFAACRLKSHMRAKTTHTKRGPNLLQPAGG